MTAMFDETVPESQELTEAVKSAVRVEEVTFIDNLPAGPGVLDSDAIIVVEGRADVLNLLRAGIKNAIAVEGTNVPQLVAELSKKKTVTVFTDSDRGGDLILKELLQVADVDYIARPPEGKSVEDLTQKEIIKALRSKVPVEQVVEVPQRRRNKQQMQQQQQQQEAARAEQNGKHEAQQREYQREYQRPERPERERGETPRRKSLRRMEERQERREPPKEQEQQPEAKKPEPREAGEFAEIMKDLAGTLSAKLLDANKNVLQKVAVRDLANVLKETNGEVKSVVFDGVITQRMLDIAAEKNLEYLVGVKMGSIVKQPANVKVITTE